jgi:hypothetical protein
MSSLLSTSDDDSGGGGGDKGGGSGDILSTRGDILSTRGEVLARFGRYGDGVVAMRAAHMAAHPKALGTARALLRAGAGMVFGGARA